MNIYRLTLLALLTTGTVYAQNGFDYSDIKKGLFSQRNVAGLRSMNDGEFYTVQRGNMIIRHRYRDASAADTVKIALKEPVTDYSFSRDERLLLVATESEPVYRHSFLANYFICDRQSGRLTPLSPHGKQREASLSPTSDRAVFVRDNNIFAVDLKSGSERAITTDGERLKIINGIPDWVYEEEFGLTCAYSWSADGNRIAFLRLDESRVPQFTLTRTDGSANSDFSSYKYPKAGDINAVAELYVYDFNSNRTTKVDTGVDECYIPRIGWTDSSELYFYRLNRHQNHFEVLTANTHATSAGPIPSRKIYEERSEQYVEQPDDQTVIFLNDGRRFIVKSEREGRMQLFLHDIEKGYLSRITDGEGEITELVDVVGDRIYYIATDLSPLRNNLYSIKINGKDKKRITTGEGTYRIAAGKGFHYFISSFSNAKTPLSVTLHSSDGKLIRTLESNEALKTRIASMKLPEKEFFTFETPDGVTLNGYMIRPSDFDPSRRYPVLMTQYSGPGSQQVVDKWSIDWVDVLVQKGYIVACVDPRGTGNRGSQFKKSTYGKLGVLETEDQLSAARYLGAMPYVDASRIGIYGWSYGGFMALNCALSGAPLFKMAIAVAPVTSWRFYDTIYTERYNGLPQENTAGYDTAAPIAKAANLQSKLLLIHGTADDNVHVTNSYHMADALIKADKQFDMMIYPNDNHGMLPSGRTHIMEKMIDYTLNNL